MIRIQELQRFHGFSIGDAWFFCWNPFKTPVFVVKSRWCFFHVLFMGFYHVLPFQNQCSQSRLWYKQMYFSIRTRLFSHVFLEWTHLFSHFCSLTTHLFSHVVLKYLTFLVICFKQTRPFQLVNCIKLCCFVGGSSPALSPESMLGAPRKLDKKRKAAKWDSKMGPRHQF